MGVFRLQAPSCAPVFLRGQRSLRSRRGWVRADNVRVSCPSCGVPCGRAASGAREMGLVISGSRRVLGVLRVQAPSSLSPIVVSPEMSADFL